MNDTLIESLTSSARPTFLMGCTPPREGTSPEKAKEICAKLTNRSAVLATDGFIVYDIQDEGGRTTMERPFPFRKTIDSSLFGSYFHELSGKQVIVYKSVVEDSESDFNEWMDNAINQHHLKMFNLVGAASSKVQYKGPSLATASKIVKDRGDCKFGCVCIPERHMSKGNEDLNMWRKTENGAEWFITQGIFSSSPCVKLITEYADRCKQAGITPKKIVLTFAPCGREKTMKFIKWLGMTVSEEVEQRILGADSPVKESIELLCELLTTILEQTRGSGVPLGLNIESLSIFKEEIDGAHTLFMKLQSILLNSYGSPWSVKWFFVTPELIAMSKSNENLVLLGNDSEKETSESKAVVSVDGVNVQLQKAAI